VRAPWDARVVLHILYFPSPLPGEREEKTKQTLRLRGFPGKASSARETEK